MMASRRSLNKDGARLIVRCQVIRSRPETGLRVLTRTGKYWPGEQEVEIGAGRTGW